MALINDILEMYSRQASDWDLLRGNIAVMENAERRILQDHDKITLTLNPKRMKSTTANVDKTAISHRECFLCAKNQPKEQERIFFTIGDNNYRIQVNPYPITTHHFTIADTYHRPQHIAGRIADIWEIAQQLEDFAILYNGPKSGASAPDHFHFQAAPYSTIPFCDVITHHGTRVTVITETDYATVSTCHDYVCPNIIVYAKSANDAMRMSEQLFDILPQEENDEEPKMNILCFKQRETGDTAICIFPRDKHRPANYGIGQGKHLISPGVFDMAGLITLVTEDDFNTIDYSVLRSILSNVSINQQSCHDILTSIKHFAINNI